MVTHNPQKNVTIAAPLITQKLTINNEPDQNNPLYGAEITLLATFNQNPVLVTKEAPATVFMLENIGGQQNMLMTTTLPDAHGLPSAGIVGLTTAITGTEQHDLHPYIFAAVKNTEGFFGQAGSGIAVVKHVTEVTEEKIKHNDGNETTNIKKKYKFELVNNGDEAALNKSAALSYDSLSINGGTGSIADTVVDMCWNPYLERLYVALQITNDSTNNEQQGSRALLLGRIDSQARLVFDPIAPDDVFYTDDAIIGACGADKKISLYMVRNMLTSTGFPYLLVVGGIGNPEDTAKNIYALPLTDTSFNKKRVDIMEDAHHGTIASKHSDTGDSYVMLARGRKLYGRDHKDAVQSVLQMPTIHDSAVKIGSGLSLPSDITDVIVCGDTVIVTVGKAGNGQLPGIFQSQAILDSTGRIAAWTPWQRFGGITQGVRTAIINPEQHFFAYLPMDKAQLISKVQIDLSKSDTKNNNDFGDISDPINQFFLSEEGGVHSLIDVPYYTPALGNQQRVSMLIATGYKKIMIIETGADDQEGIFQPYHDHFTNITECDDATVVVPNEMPETPAVLAVSGGALDELGSIQAATIATNGSISWVVVGGMQGLAVLAAPDGTGWCSAHGIGTHFRGLNQPLQFKKIGTYKYIKKLIADHSNVYIVTNTRIERICLTKEAIKNNAFTADVVVDSPNNSIFDCVISGPLAILATAQGLLFNNDGFIDLDIAQEISWKRVELPLARGAVSKIFAVSSTGLSTGVSNQGQLYVSVGDFTLNSSTIYRLYVHDIYKEGITDCSVELIPDHLFFNKPFPMISFNSFRDCFATDGAQYLSARSRHLGEQPFLQAITPAHIKNQLASDAVSYTIPLNIGKSSKKITGIVQNSATGNWLIAGDFGLRIHN